MCSSTLEGPAYRWGLIILCGLTLGWGLGWPIMKVALDEVPPWSFRTFCLLGGGGAILAVAWKRKESLRISREEMAPLLLVAAVNVTGWNILSAYGVMLSRAGKAAILAYTMPLWAALFSRWILKEKLTKSRILALSSGLCGLGVLLAPELVTLQERPWGSVLMLGAAICWALGSVLIKRRRWGMSASVFAGWQLVLGGVPVFAGMFVLEESPWAIHLSWNGLLATSYIVVVGVVLGYWGWIRVIEIFPVTKASIGTMAVPCIGLISGRLVLAEPISVTEIAGLGLVLLGLLGILRETPEQGGHGS